MRNGPFTSGAGARNSRFVLLGVAMLAIGLDVGVARITYGVVLPAFARDLQLSLTAAGLLGTLHLIGYLLGTLASPSLNAKVGALALCRASHFVLACAMLVCGLTSDITMMAAGRFVAGLAAGFGVFSIFLIVFDATRTGKAFRRGIAGLVRHGVATVASGLACGRLDSAGHRRSRAGVRDPARWRGLRRGSRRVVRVRQPRRSRRGVRRVRVPSRSGSHRLFAATRSDLWGATLPSRTQIEARVRTCTGFFPARVPSKQVFPADNPARSSVPKQNVRIGLVWKDGPSRP
jgi:hypothetical protein